MKILFYHIKINKKNTIFGKFYNINKIKKNKHLSLKKKSVNQLCKLIINFFYTTMVSFNKKKWYLPLPKTNNFSACTLEFYLSKCFFMTGIKF